MTVGPGVKPTKMGDGCDRHGDPSRQLHQGAGIHKNAYSGYVEKSTSQRITHAIGGTQTRAASTGTAELLLIRQRLLYEVH